MRRRVLLSLAASAVLAVVFAARTFTDFTGVRIKVIRQATSSVGGRVRVLMPESDRVVPAPAAIIWTAENPSSTATDLALAVDGRAICTRHLAHGAARFDCQDDVTTFRGGQQSIDISGPAGPWWVSSLEVAVLHGRASSPENLVILPVGSRAYAAPSTIGVAAAWLAMFLLLLVPAHSSRSRGLVWLHRMLAALTVILLTGVALSARVSSYAVVVSVETFAQWVAILYAWRLWTVVRWLSTPRGIARAPRLRVWIQRAVLAGCVLLAFGSSVRWLLQHAFHGNYSGILRIGRAHFDHNTIFGPERDVIRPTLVLDDGGGYDGQWVYFMTFDPLLRRFYDDPVRYNGVVDAPPYRFGRIGLSAAARLLTAGRWPLVPAVLVWLVLFGTVAAAIALSEIALAQQRSLWMGALVVSVPGFWESVSTGLSEPLAAALMLTAILLAMRTRWLAAAAVCAASLLTRETGLICAITILGYAAWRGQWRRAILFGAVALVPLAIWRLYVGVTLHSVWGMQAFFYSPDDIGLPFHGFSDLWSAVRAHVYYPDDPGLARAAIAYPLLLTTGLGLAIATTVVSFNPCALAAVGYALLGVSLRFASIWVHMGNGQRGTFELFVMLAVSATQSTRWPRWLRRFNLAFWIFALLYIFYLSFNAGGTRQGLVELV